MLASFGMVQKEQIRAFLAIQLAEALKREAATSVGKLQTENPHFRFIPPEHWHLTLHFFGSVSSEKLEEVKKGLKEAVQNTPSFSIGLKDFGVFPDRRAPHVLWMGVESRLDALVQLKVQVDAAIIKMGFPVEERKFHPHLTIARSRENRNKKEVSFGNVSFTGTLRQTVDQLALFRSELRSEGPIYTVLDTFFLKS